MTVHLYRYTYRVGITARTIEVLASDDCEGDGKARCALDNIAHGAGKEAPVRWDITLIKKENV